MSAPSLSTAMPNKPRKAASKAAPSKSAQLVAWIDKYRPPRVGPAEMDLLKAHLAPVSDEYLRRLLRETKVPMEHS